MATPPARKVILPNKQEVLFWFNIGPARENRDRVYVTDAKCPHQGVCLLSGELNDIEDLPQGAEKRGMVRCPRHNKTFDLATGESPGNCEILQTFPSRFHDGRFYVRVAAEKDVKDVNVAQGDADVEMQDANRFEPELKRPRFDQLPTPTANSQPRRLGRHMTLG
eukprot:symbB.v1.2.010173.t1/scaffold651.1/size176249/3